MANRTIQTDFTGEVGIEPRLDRMVTTNTLEQVLTPGYLNNAAAAAGVSFLPADFVFINYNNGAGGTKSNLFTLNVGPTGVITLVQETGEVSGPGTSYDNQVVLFAGTSGQQIKGVDFTPDINSMFGFNNTGTPSQVTVGSGLTLSGGTLTASGAGSGDVIGPGSATAGGLVFFSGTTGKIIENTPFSPVANSLVGYDNGGIPANIVAGTNVTISGGTISVASGAGNVTGTGTSVAGVFPVYLDTTGLAIHPSAVTLTNDTLVGFTGGAIHNITAGSGITISGGVIASSAGGGNVSGTGTSVAGLFPVYADTTGLEIAPGSFALTNNTLLGFNAGAIHNITAGTGITIAGGVISAPAGGGTVTGPVSSEIGALTVYAGTDGKSIKEPTYTPAANSLVGYGPTGTAVVNITAGANINISDEGVLSASGGSGGGDVTGPPLSVDGGLVLFSGTSGKFIDNVAYTPTPDTIIGYNSATHVSNVRVGTGLNLSGGVLTQLRPVVISGVDVFPIAINNNTLYALSANVLRRVWLPDKDSVPIGWEIDVFACSAFPAVVEVLTGNVDIIIQFVDSDGAPNLASSFIMVSSGRVTITRVGQIGTATATPWMASGNIG